MELVKDVDTEYKDYLRIRNVLKKGYSHPGVISSLCKKHWKDSERIKNVREKLEHLVEWGQVEKIEVEKSIGVSVGVVKNYKYILKETPSSLYSSLGVDSVVGWQKIGSMKGRIKFDKLLNIISSFYSQPKTLLLSTCRKRELVVARQMFCYIAKFNMPNITLKEIGSFLGGRDHSTVIHGIRTAGDLIETNKQFRKEYEKLETFILSKL
jgi:hypothetical protein